MLIMLLGVASSCTSTKKDISTYEIFTFEDSVRSTASAKNCGFSSKEAFLYSGQKSLEEFAKHEFYPQFTKWWMNQQGDVLSAFLSQFEKEQQQQARSQSENISKYPSARHLYHIRNEILKMPELKSLSQFAWFDFQPTEDCPSAACTIYGSYGILIPHAYLERIYKENSLAKANGIMRAIVGHEIGHFIVESNLMNQFSDSKIAFESLRQKALNHHLSVDSVSIAINSVSVQEFIGMLEATVASESEKGDVPDRIACLKVLAEVTPELDENPGPSEK